MREPPDEYPLVMSGDNGSRPDTRQGRQTVTSAVGYGMACAGQGLQTVLHQTCRMAVATSSGRRNTRPWCTSTTPATHRASASRSASRLVAAAPLQVTKKCDEAETNPLGSNSIEDQRTRKYADDGSHRLKIRIRAVKPLVYLICIRPWGKCNRELSGTSWVTAWECGCGSGRG